MSNSALSRNGAVSKNVSSTGLAINRGRRTAASLFARGTVIFAFALPLPAAELALILRAVVIGLAVEALIQPGEIDGDLVALIVSQINTAGRG
jgi:hypothetical protein